MLFLLILYLCHSFSWRASLQWSIDATGAGYPRIRMSSGQTGALRHNSRRHKRTHVHTQLLTNKC